MSLEADGVWRGGVWAATVWADDVWREGEGAPEPEVTTQTPAGKPKRRRMFVEIDGQHFQVSSAQEAAQLLQQARALAEQQAEQKAKRAEKFLKKREKVPEVRIAAPEIKVSPEISTDVGPIIADIERLYRKAAEMAEMRLLLARQFDEDDEEDLLLLL